MRRSVGDHAAVFEHKHTVAQSKDLFAVVSDVNDRNTVGRVPGSQILDDLRFGGRIECRHRFVEQQNAWIGHKGAGECHPLAFAARNFSWLAFA